ncbi:MAG: hypothetical protein ABIC91_03870 [Nanoarchaeota archaeon]|nr:hypothetical protein [Nanoarchaeota archaeon]MBU1030430.1 hypothetical protein [Nanoarchaeota archaeon]MBU1849787.1 hypothetical protein [Nanoarchaeota archaeon]
MTIVGFNFTKILVEKKKPVKGKISINNNVMIKNVVESKLNVGNDKKSLQISFLYTALYEPGIGGIELSGEMVFLVDDAKAKEVLDSWKKKKVLPENTRNEIMNSVLNKCSIQSLILSKDMNLPSPIPLPKIK